MNGRDSNEYDDHAFRKHEWLFDYSMMALQAYVQVPRTDIDRSRKKLQFLIEVKKNSISASVDNTSSTYEPLLDDETMEDYMPIFARTLTYTRDRHFTADIKRKNTLLQVTED